MLSVYAEIVVIVLLFLRKLWINLSNIDLLSIGILGNNMSKVSVFVGFNIEDTNVKYKFIQAFSRELIPLFQ